MPRPSRMVRTSCRISVILLRRAGRGQLSSSSVIACLRVRSSSVAAARDSTTAAIRSAASSGSSCSQTRMTVQPRSVERRVGAPVPVDVRVRASPPTTSLLLFGIVAVLRAAVPEASVHEDRDPRAPEQRRRRSRAASARAVAARGIAALVRWSADRSSRSGDVSRPRFAFPSPSRPARTAVVSRDWLGSAPRERATSSGSALARRRSRRSRSERSWPSTSSTTARIAGQSRLMLIASGSTLDSTTFQVSARTVEMIAVALLRDRDGAGGDGLAARAGAPPGATPASSRRRRRSAPHLPSGRSIAIRASLACSSSVRSRFHPPAWIRRSRR